MASAYSYHTYYFPFTWDNAGKFEFDAYIKEVEKLGIWNDISVKGLADASDSRVADYQTLQFYTEAARKAVFGGGANFVKCYEYKKVNDASEYVIKKVGECDYRLKLEGIKLKIYNTGIGILTFEAENYNYQTLKDVKFINEYGRRIFAPFISDGTCSLCADKLGVTLSDGGHYSDISHTVPKTQSECIPKFVKELLPDSEITTAIDDRMFVACLVIDADEFEKLMHYEENTEASESLYELLYIDKDKNCSCPTKSMREKLLERSVYRRWLENKVGGNCAGTLHGVTHHSFVCLTTCKIPEFVETPFLRIYTHMVSAVLAQRATIIALDARVSELSAGFEKKGSYLNGKRIKNLNELQEKHIAFLNQHMNIELTCQEQGIEIYELLQREMYVERESASLSDEIRSLSEAANTATEHGLSRWAFWISVILGVWEVGTFVLENTGILNFLLRLFLK